MKKTQKRVVGFCGLAAVVATTVFAATLPGPDASAATQSGFTDTLNVRVIGEKPLINVTSPTPGKTVVSPVQRVTFTYEGVDNITVKITYTDPDGVTQVIPYGSVIQPDYAPGSFDDVIDLSGMGYGYGDYVITVEGYGPDGVPSSDSVSFSYYPVNVDIETTPGTPGSDDGGDGTGGGGSDGGGTDGGGTDGTGGASGGDYTLNFEYDTESGMAVPIGATVLINNNDDGRLVKEMSVEPFPTDTYRLVFANYGLPSGTYKITVRVAYSYKDKTYYVDYTYIVTYKAASMAVPDTGGILGNLNISKSDYLVTGLIVFGIVGVAGFVSVARRGKKSTSRRK